MMIALALLLQAAAAPPPDKFSILAPIANEPCVPGRTAGGADIVVCGDPLPVQQLPYPAEATPYGPQPSNPDRTGIGALRAESDAPCSSTIHGCLVGFGPPIVPIIKGVAGVVGRTFAKKPDKTGRVAISLDDQPLPPGRIEP